jgi:F-type H+-transporting ATPase subunit b
VDVLTIGPGAVGAAVALAAEEGGAAEPGFQINLFWIITQAVSFLLFLGILYLAAFRRIGGVLEERRRRIEQGLRDADAARVEREQAADERLAVLTQARQEANEIVNRAQKVAEEARERQMAETRAELERLRAQAAEEIEVEKQRALSEVRGVVAELALSAAGKVVGETMNEPRERRLVQEFLTQVSAGQTGPDGRSTDGRTRG